MRMFFVFIFLCFTLSEIFSQTIDIDRKHSSDYDIKGNVKSVVIDEVKEIYVSGSQKVMLRNIRRCYFNKDGFLIKSYLKNNDGFEFLLEENIYDIKNNLLYKLKQSRKDTIIGDSVVFTSNLKTYETKYHYDSVGNLLSEYQKSYRDKAFYLTQKNTFLKNKLTESLGINNHIPFRYYTEGEVFNYLTRYYYDINGLLIKRKDFNDTTTVYFKLDNMGNTILKPFLESEIDYSKFTLKNQVDYTYDKKSRLVKKGLLEILKSSEQYSIVTEYEYFGSYTSKKKFTTKQGEFWSSIDYVVIDKDTLEACKWNFSKYHLDEKPNKEKVYEIIYNHDKSFKKMLFNRDGKIEKTSFYNSKGKFVKQDPELISDFKIEEAYDSRGNLIVREVFSKSKNKLVSSVKKTITYYN